MSVKFDHTQESLHLALGIDDERSDALDAIMFFCIIDQNILRDSLFDDPDEAPMNMRTKTGILEKAFDEAKNEPERIYLSMEYGKIDTDLDNDNNGIRTFMKGLLMMYEGVDGNLHKFISKFISYKNKAKKAFENSCDEDDDDE
jgi:hypothetical protein